jgi:prevent-host-death family protein
METINIHEAKTHLSRLMEKVSKGESFIIAKAGKPIGKLVPLGDTETPKKRRIGFTRNRDCGSAFASQRSLRSHPDRSGHYRRDSAYNG